MNIKSTKTFHNFPCTHRQHMDTGHCKFVHGYSRSFHFIFGCKELDGKGWAVNFGGLNFIKSFLEANFDHTFLSSLDDPYLATWRLLDGKALSLRVLPYGVSMEGTARWVYEQCSWFIRDLYNERCWIESVEVRENDKNSAIYYGREP